MLEGYFTVVGRLGHYTFRVEKQADDADFAPGKTIISHLIGSDNVADYQAFGFVSDDGSLRPWKSCKASQHTLNAARYLLKGDMAAAGKAYAVESGNCWRCGRMLTTPDSVAMGLGPTCAAKVAAVVVGEHQSNEDVLEDDMKRFEKNLKQWSKDALSKNVDMERLNCAKTKPAMVAALVAHRRSTLLQTSVAA